MKNEKIKEFLTKIAQEEGFKVEFLKLKEKVEKKGFSKKDNEKFISEYLLPWSKKLGYKLSKKDFIDFDRTQKPTEITGLSPAELENVSGGAFPMLFALFAMFGSALAGGIGGGDSTNKNQKKGQDSFSTSLTQYRQADSGETTLAMLRDGHQINDIILDAYMHPQDGLPDSPAGLLDWDGYSQGAADGANADASSQQVQPAPAGDIYSPINPSTWQDVPEQTGTAEGAGTTTPTAAQGSTGIASMDYGIEYDNYEANYGETPADFGSGAGKPMSTALVTTPDQPQTSVTDYNENFARSPVAEALRPATSSSDAHQAQPTPAGDAFSPINPSTWNEIPEQSGSVGNEQPQTSVKGNRNTTGIASVDNYLVGEGEILSDGGQTPVDFENPKNTSVEQVQTETEGLDDLNPFGLNQNMFSQSSTPLVTTSEPSSQEPIPGLWDRIGNYFKSAQDRRRELDTDRQTNFDGFEGTPEEIAQHNYENYGETSAKEYDKHYARTSPGDYDQNYARSSRPAAHTFNMVDLSSKNGVHTETLGAPLGVPSEVSDALDAYPQTGGTSQQTRLAGNVSQYGENIGASSPIPLGAPEGLDISATSSALGGQETINMLKDIHAAENANFKATETQTNQDSAGKSISTALVTTPGQPQPSVDDYNKRFARFSAAVDSGENVVQMLKDIHVEANDGSAVGYALSTAPETTPVQHEILQQTESAGSTIELLGLEGENSTSSGPVSGVTSGGIRWHLNTKGETVFDRDISSAQTTTTTTTGGSNSGPGTTTTSASTPSSTGSPSVGLLGYSQSSAGSGSVVSEQAQPGVPAPDFNITTGFAGGGTPAEAPLPGQINTTQGNSTFSATQNNTTSNTTSESFTSSSSQNGQSWKDIVKGTAQMTGIAAGLGAAALGTVYTAASVASALSGDGAQQTANKTKGTSKKTEDKKSTKETKKDGSDFMRSFMETLQKNSPEASQYLDSLK